MSSPERTFFRHLHGLVVLSLLSAGVVTAGTPGHAHGLATPTRPWFGLANDPTLRFQEDSGMAASRWWTRLYATAFYDTRWNGWFLQSYLQHGYDLLPDKRL